MTWLEKPQQSVEAKVNPIDFLTPKDIKGLLKWVEKQDKKDIQDLVDGVLWDKSKNENFNIPKTLENELNKIEPKEIKIILEKLQNLIPWLDIDMIKQLLADFLVQKKTRINSINKTIDWRLPYIIEPKLNLEIIDPITISQENQKELEKLINELWDSIFKSEIRKSNTKEKNND